MTIPKFTCTCPDFTNRQPANPAGQSISRQVSRDWSSEFNGVASKQLYCKHIIRVLIELNLIEEWGIPKDMPFPPMWKTPVENDNSRLQPDRSKGDDFSFNWMRKK